MRLFWRRPGADRDPRGRRAASAVGCSRAAATCAMRAVPSKALRGRKGRETGEAACQGSDAAPARPVADAVRAGAGGFLGDAGFSIRVPTAEYISAHGLHPRVTRPAARSPLRPPAPGSGPGCGAGGLAWVKSWAYSARPDRNPSESGEFFAVFVLSLP